MALVLVSILTYGACGLGHKWCGSYSSCWRSIAQQEGYADVSRGNGVIVAGLASLIIGEVL